MKKLVLLPALATLLIGSGCAMNTTTDANASAASRNEGEVLTGSRIRRSADENVYGTKSTERDKYDPNATLGNRGTSRLPGS
jgi:hypothetical protein